ncbi:MAG TPA: hypothetical protein VGX91_14830 [Candidatus Cybelea sp.]|jgi:hypothetical protein|nr:hypothetical protein [Candidatus Cybelea sp.]
MLFPFGRVLALLMAGVLCFGILVPMAVARHAGALAVAIGIVYVAYLIANVVLWRRMRSRT